MILNYQMRMDNWHKTLGGLLIMALIYIVFLQQCGTECKPEIVEVDTVENVTVYDTTWHNTTRYNYITVKIQKPYFDTIQIFRGPIFTGTENFDIPDDKFMFPSIYKDTVNNDTISLYYKARVRGYLDDLTLGYKIYTPFYIEKTTIVQTVKKNRFKGFYIGLDAGANKDGLSHFAPTLELAAGRFSYNLGFNIVNQSVIGGMRRKIRFKK